VGEQYYTENLKETKEAFLERMDRLFKDVLDRFDLSTRIDTDERKVKPRGIVNPEIVLTQSFV